MMIAVSVRNNRRASFRSCIGFRNLQEKSVRHKFPGKRQSGKNAPGVSSIMVFKSLNDFIQGGCPWPQKKRSLPGTCRSISTSRNGRPPSGRWKDCLPSTRTPSSGCESATPDESSTAEAKQYGNISAPPTCSRNRGSCATPWRSTRWPCGSTPQTGRSGQNGNGWKNFMPSGRRSDPGGSRANIVRRRRSRAMTWIIIPCGG